MRTLFVSMYCLLFTTIVVAQPQAVERRLVGNAEQVDGSTYPLNLQAIGITLPRIIDGGVDRRLHDPRTIFYRLPQVYQQYTPASRVEHRDLALGTTHFSSRPGIWGLFRTSYLHEYNANPDFPWESTFGLNFAHRDGKIPNTYDVFNFISLPTDEEGRLIPIIVLTDERPIKWLFPPETLVGEVIYVKHEGMNYIQEIRTRKKSADSKTWFPGIYRPVKNRDEFKALTRIAYEPSKRFVHLRNPEEDEVMSVSGTLERLPGIDAQSVAALLSRPFQDVTDENWHPAADIDFHILPKDYTLGLLGQIDSKACANCHRQTQISARNLTPKEPKLINNPMLVGNIRGCDAVFTWYPFSMQSVTNDGSVARTIFVRRFDAENKTIQLVGKGQTPNRQYKITKFVQDSLKDYELPLDAQYLHDVTPRKGPCDCVQCPCGVGKCGCKESCDCPVPSKGMWRPLADNRIVAVAPDPGITVNINQKLNIEQQQRPMVMVDNRRIRWVFSDGVYYARDDNAKRWLGVYDPKDGFYRDVVREQADGMLVIGNVSVPPISLPQESLRNNSLPSFNQTKRGNK